MRSMICPLCGCGKKYESFITGYECENCGETFNTDDSGEFRSLNMMNGKIGSFNLQRSILEKTQIMMY